MSKQKEEIRALRALDMPLCNVVMYAQAYISEHKMDSSPWKEQDEEYIRKFQIAYKALSAVNAERYSDADNAYLEEADVQDI